MYLAYAKAKDLGDFNWFTYEGTRKIQLGLDYEFNQRHPLIVQPGSLVGLKKAARGPGAGNYQIVLGVALHVLFRNVPIKQIQRLEKYLKQYKGRTPEHDQILDGKKRSAKVSIREKSTSDRLTDDYFKPSGIIREASSYSKENYQWRKVIAQKVIIRTLKQGKSRGQVVADDVIGLRYMTKTRGGFILLPDGQRINIDHNTYASLVEGSRILPSSRQQKGIVVLADIKATQPKQTRERKKKDLDAYVPRDPLDTNDSVVRSIKRNAQPHLSGVGDFDDDEDDDLGSLHTPKLHTPPKAHSPMSVLKEGKIIRSARKPSDEYVVSGAKDYGTYSEFSVFNVDTGDTKLLRITNDTDMSVQKNITLHGQADRIIHAQAKRALHKAVNEKKFAVGTIHD